MRLSKSFCTSQTSPQLTVYLMDDDTCHMKLYDDPSVAALFTWPLNPDAPPAVISWDDEIQIHKALKYWGVEPLFFECMLWIDLELHERELDRREGKAREDHFKWLEHFRWLCYLTVHTEEV